MDDLDNVKRCTDDYHCIPLNLVVLVTYMQEVEQKRYAGAKALVPIGRPVQLDPDCSICGGWIFNRQFRLNDRSDYNDTTMNLATYSNSQIQAELEQSCVCIGVKALVPMSPSVQLDPDRTTFMFFSHDSWFIAS